MQPDRVRAGFDTLVRLDMTNGPALAAAILAGGHARRLGGVNKGTLTIGTTPIIDRQLDVLRALATDVLLVGREDLIFVNVNTPHDYERAKGLIEWKPESTQDRITTGRTGSITDAD